MSPKPIKNSKIGSGSSRSTTINANENNFNDRSSIHVRSTSSSISKDSLDSLEPIDNSFLKYRRGSTSIQESNDEILSTFNEMPNTTTNRRTPQSSRPTSPTSPNSYPTIPNSRSKRWQPPSFGLRRILFLLMITTTALVIIYKPSISDIKSSPYLLPSSWTDSSISKIPLEFSTLIPSERKLAIKQNEYALNMEPYFPSKPTWGGGPHQAREDYKFYTEQQLRKLAVCTATNTCRENQTSVIILGHIYNHFHLYDGYMGGEGIWTASLVQTLTKWGYTILHARDDWVYIWYLHNQIPDMVKGIIAWKTGQYGTFEDQMKSGRRPNGIPAWKFFVYNYFPDHYSSMVGDAWNMHSEYGYSKQQMNFTFIPYIVEKASSPPYTPTIHRPNQIYILAKFVRYFYPGTQPAWEDPGIFLRAKNILEKEFPGFEFVVGCKDDRNEAERKSKPMEVPAGIRNLGIMNRTEFERQLANSRGMLGIGWPNLSPSPHVALSLGIPWISPYSMYGWSSYDDPSTWAQSQHHTLKALDEPYVYHVYRNNETQFIEAIRKALSTPIEPYILPIMTKEYHEKQVGKWLSTDWKAKAAKILENRKNGLETENGKEVKEFAL